MRTGAHVGVLLFSSLLMPTASAADNPRTVPDFSGQWGRDMLFFEPPSSGPGPVMNLFRNPDSPWLTLVEASPPYHMQLP